MIQKYSHDLFDVVRSHYQAVDERHRVSASDQRLEIEMGDWANPIDIGEVNVIHARQSAEPPAHEYGFTFSVGDGELADFVIRLHEDRVEIERVDLSKEEK